MHAYKAAPASLPDNLRLLFWDCDFEMLQWPNDMEFITGRILTSGEWDALQWLRTQIGDTSLREWFKSHHGGGLSPERLRFWELVLRIPHRIVDSWILKESRTIWRQRAAR
jgi:hypothetical protein